MNNPKTPRSGVKPVRRRKGVRPAAKNGVVVTAKVRAQPVAKKRPVGKAKKPAASGKTKPRKTPHVLNQIFGQFAVDKKNRCIEPSVITRSDQTGMLEDVLAVIDEFIFRAMISKPSHFSITTSGGIPDIKISDLRGTWLQCFQYYMYKCNSMIDRNNSGVSYGSLRIPIGLAKIFQQYAPFCDTNTGSVYRTNWQEVATTASATYGSVDSNTATADRANMNQPGYRYLIHPSLYNGVTKLVEFATLGNKSTQTYDGAQVPFNDLFNAMSSTSKTAIQNLYSGTITVDSIPTTAPDGSAYASVNSSCVSAPFPAFRSDITIMIGLLQGDDEFVNYPFDKPLTVCRAYGSTGAEALPASAAYKNTILATYAYLTSFSTKWASGSAIGLMRSTKCFTDVTDFSYRGVTLDLAVFSRKVFNAYKSDTWSKFLAGSADLVNASFAFCQMSWSALLTRLAPTAVIDSTGSALTNTCFYVNTSSSDTMKLPITISKMIAGVGPVRVGGHVIFPRFGVAYANFNCPGVPVYSWSNAITTAGEWIIPTVGYGFGPSVTTSTAKTVTQPGTGGTPFSRTNPANVVYSNIMVVGQVWYTQYYQNLLPTAFATDSLSGIPNEICGTLSCMLAINNSNIVVTMTAAWSNDLLTTNGVERVSVSTSNYCTNSKDMLNNAFFGIVENSDNIRESKRPLRQYFIASILDGVTTVQSQNNTSEGSQYFASLRAIEFAKLSKTRKPNADAQFAVNSKVLDKIVDAFSSAVSPPGSGDREQATHSLEEMVTNAKEFDTGEKILTSLIGFGSQGENGEPSFFSRVAVNVGNFVFDKLENYVIEKQNENLVPQMFLTQK